MRIIKKAVEIGNGAAVYVPKEYGGKSITILLPEGIEEIKKRVLSKLINFMPNVLGVYLYGSYARDEETNESDIDVLTIVQERDERIKNCIEDMDLRVLTLKNVKDSVKNFPIPIMTILQESKVFLNPLLLQELKQEKINLNGIKWHFEEINRMIRIIEKFIEVDEINIDPSQVYSLMMRARVLYMIECLIMNKSFSNENVRKRIQGYGLDSKLFENYYTIYQKIRNNEKTREIIEKKEIEMFIEIIKKYSKTLENETKKKSKKRN